MLVRELIQELLGMNMDATVINDEDFETYELSKRNGEIHVIVKESEIIEVEQSGDLEYVRLW